MLRPIEGILFSALVAWFPVQASVVLAEDPPVTQASDAKAPLKPAPEHPTPDPKIIDQDVTHVTTEIEEREREDELVRDTLRGPNRRPDLDHDVTSGIQGRNLDKALHGR